ncbi:hypothetical protein D3C81_1329370 [compost metagenome]
MFQLQQVIIADLSSLMRAYTFKDGGQGQFPSFAVYAGFHWAAADEDGWNVDAQRAHHHPRCDFVAVRNANHAVEPVRRNDGLERVGDDFPAWQGVAHANMAHRNTVIHTDGIKLKRNASGFANGFLYDLAELLQVHMSWHDIDIRVADRDKRFAEIFFFHAGGTQQTAVRRTVEAFFDHIRTHLLGCHDHRSPHD